MAARCARTSAGYPVRLLDGPALPNKSAADQRIESQGDVSARGGFSGH